MVRLRRLDAPYNESSEPGMRTPRITVRDLMFHVWLTALLAAGAADIIRERRARDHVQVINESTDLGGSTSMTLLWSQTTYYYVGPIPLGPCPVATLSGVAFVGSVVAWVLLGRRKARRSAQVM
jgi:hypothetical protein